MASILTDRRQGLYIDPIIRDLVVENGDLKMDETQQSAVLLSLALEFGSSAANPTGGCKIYTIRKALGIVPELARQYVQEALQGRIDDGRIDDVEVAAEFMGPTILAWEVSYTDKTSEHVVISLPTGAGVP